MEIIYLLIPLSLVLVLVAIAAFSWASKSGQFDDLDSPALSILDDEPSTDAASLSANTVDRERNNSQENPK